MHVKLISHINISKYKNEIIKFEYNCTMSLIETTKKLKKYLFEITWKEKNEK